jgi:hypothetical protein
MNTARLRRNQRLYGTQMNAENTDGGEFKKHELDPDEPGAASPQPKTLLDTDGHR